MNKLFAIHRIDNNKKEEKLKIFNIKTPKELENNHLTFKLYKNQINISNNKENASSSTFSRKNSLNLLSSEPLSSFNLNTSANSAIKTNETSKFLGKKIKINFEELKENVVNLQNDLIQNISINEKTDSENPANIQNIKYKENKTILNTGRWSTEEHKKFIEGLKVYGKNWKKIQKLIGTRSITQARSHAQKFLMKLKIIKNPCLNLDFSNDKVKNLSDSIKEIKKKNINQEEKKIFSINTLINLSDSISNEGIESNKKENITKNLKIKKYQEKENIIKESFNNNMNNCSKILFIKEEEKKGNININENNIYDKNINKNFEKNLNKKEKINITQNNSDFQINKKLFFDDGFAFYLDNYNDYFGYNNITFRIKEYYYNTNFESISIINKNFFS